MSIQTWADPIKDSFPDASLTFFSPFDVLSDDIKEAFPNARFVNPSSPVSFTEPDGSILTYIWESTLYPDDKHESENLMELTQFPCGSIHLDVSFFSRPADLVIR